MSLFERLRQGGERAQCALLVGGDAPRVQSLAPVRGHGFCMAAAGRIGAWFGRNGGRGNGLSCAGEGVKVGLKAG